MKQPILTIISCLTAAVILPGLASADDEVSLTGTLSCGKCNLKEADSCADVLTVADGDKKVNYWLEEEGNVKTSEHQCSGTKEDVTVNGKVEEKDGKKVLVVSSFGAKAEEVTKEGTLSCAKCNLKLTSACEDVLTVKEDGKEVNYWLKEDGKAKTSEHECSGAKEGVKVTGTLTEKGDRKEIAVASFDS